MEREGQRRERGTVREGEGRESKRRGEGEEKERKGKNFRPPPLIVLLHTPLLKTTLYFRIVNSAIIRGE